MEVVARESVDVGVKNIRTNLRHERVHTGDELYSLFNWD